MSELAGERVGELLEVVSQPSSWPVGLLISISSRCSLAAAVVVCWVWLTWTVALPYEGQPDGGGVAITSGSKVVLNQLVGSFFTVSLLGIVTFKILFALPFKGGEGLAAHPVAVIFFTGAAPLVLGFLCFSPLWYLMRFYGVTLPGWFTGLAITLMLVGVATTFHGMRRVCRLIKQRAGGLIGLERSASMVAVGAALFPLALTQCSLRYSLTCLFLTNAHPLLGLHRRFQSCSFSCSRARSQQQWG